jgi:hypothetical protein
MTATVDTTKLQTGPANVYLRELGSGTIAITSTGVTGTLTKFLTELHVGDTFATIVLTSGVYVTQTFIVATVTDDTTATTTVAASPAIAAATPFYHDTFIGGTDDGTEVSVKTDSIALTVSQLGTTPADKVVTGVEVMVKVVLKEIKLESFKRAIASATTIVDDSAPTHRRLEIVPKPGLSLRSIAKRLTIKPILGAVETTDKEAWIVAPIAAPDATTVKVAFSNTAQRVIEANFYCFPDTANANRCLFMGDESAADVTTPFGIIGP